MPNSPIEDAVNAIADGTPVAWSTLTRAPDSGDAQLEGVRLLEDIANAFRSVAPKPTRQRPAPVFRWGNLDVERRIGTGSFGEVWCAFDPWLGRTVALKLQRAGAETRRAEQLDEARRLARVRHQNVLACYGCAVHDGRAGLWSELIAGRSLAEVLTDDGALSIEETLRIGRDLARALAAVHAVGLVHGDVKPGNVMRETGGRVVLMDFGAGGDERLLASRQLVSGTPAYLAPEVLDGSPPSTRTDIYALGVLLFVLLTGRTPYTADSVAELGDAQRDGRRPTLARLRPDLDARALATIEQCIDIDPARRPHDAITLAAAFAAALSDEPRTIAKRRLHPARWLLAASAAAAIGITVAVAWPRLFAPAWTADAAFVRSAGDAVETLADRASVTVGDHLKLRLHSNRAAYVYVLNEDADGNAIVLYPLDAGAATARHTDTDVLLPGDSAHPTLAWEITGDSASEEFLVIAALQPVGSLDAMLANWQHTVRTAPKPTTRSVGAVVEDADLPMLRATHLNGVLARLGNGRRDLRTWRFAFVHRH